MIATTAAEGTQSGLHGDDVRRYLYGSAGTLESGPISATAGPITAGPIAAMDCDEIANGGSHWWCNDGLLVVGGAGWLTAMSTEADEVIATEELPEVIVTALALGDDGAVHNGGSHWIEDPSQGRWFLGRWTPGDGQTMLAQGDAPARIYGPLLLGTGQLVAAAVSSPMDQAELVMTDADAAGPAGGWSRRLGDLANAGAPVPHEGQCGGSNELVWATEVAVDGSAKLSAVAAHGDGVVVAGQHSLDTTTDVLVYRLSPTGKVIWTRSLGTDGGDDASTILVRDNATIALLGESSASDWLGDGVVHFLDSDGQVLDSRLFGGVGNQRFEAGLEEPDGRLVLVGKTNAGGDDDAWLVVTDAIGDPLLNMSMGGASEQRAFAVASNDAGWVIAGRALVKGSIDGALWQCDETGDVLWSRAFGAQYKDTFSDVIVQPDGVILAVGTTTPSPAAEMGWVVRLDPSTFSVWESTLPVDEVAAIVRLDDGLAVVGDGPKMAKLSDMGALLTTRDIVPGVSGRARAAAITGTGGLWVAGYGWENGAAGPLIIRTDAWGSGSCEDAGACLNVLPMACDDSNPCTADGCSPATGACTHSPLADGSPCPGGVCSAGLCD